MKSNEIKTPDSSADFLRDREYICENLNFMAAEAYKMLRTNIGFSLASIKGCKTIGITSARRAGFSRRYRVDRRAAQRGDYRQVPAAHRRIGGTALLLDPGRSGISPQPRMLQSFVLERGYNRHGGGGDPRREDQMLFGLRRHTRSGRGRGNRF